MNFNDMPYERVSYEDIERRYRQLMEELRSAKKPEACEEILNRRQQLNDDLTPMELCYVRHDMDVNDPFYAAEQDYYDEIGPKLSDLSNQFDRLLLDSPHRPYLEELLGRQAFAVMEEAQRAFDARLIPLTQEENTLLGRYNQLVSNASVLWMGEQVKRSLMSPELNSADRETRRKASLAVSDSWEAQRAELEEIYGKLVQNRRLQAQTLGLSSYVELSYHRMYRIGYRPAQVAGLRETVKKRLVPLITQLEDRRRQRLSLDRFRFYDSGIFFPDGNPKPLGGTQECLETTRGMYTALSPETAEFIDFMLDNHLYDVEIRSGKRGGGYMTFFEKYRAPFIFANFDGTSENAYIMCHEGGHAFQAYLKREERLRDRCTLTSEAAETHAMAMEFFTYPYMEQFFGGRAEDYRTMHLEDALRLIARECEQDEFQQLIYEQPDMTAQERNALWARLEKEYCPSRDYAGNPNLEAGCGWQRIPHMFLWPFYAIDYALAQLCALEYYQWMNEDQAGAWQSYLLFCRQTGTKSFPELVESAGLKNPFAEETITELTGWLSKHMQLCR